jgi:hypothetical protein
MKGFKMETNIRYYYDCPLIAAYMAKYFDMNFIKEGIIDEVSHVAYQIIPFEDFGTGGVSLQCNTGKIKRKFIIHPESVHLLEPQDGDLILFEGDCPEGSDIYPMYWNKDYKIGEFDGMWGRITYQDSDNFVGCFFEITRRNCMPFLMPKKEVLNQPDSTGLEKEKLTVSSEAA